MRDRVKVATLKVGDVIDPPSGLRGRAAIFSMEEQPGLTVLSCVYIEGLHRKPTKHFYMKPTERVWKWLRL